MHFKDVRFKESTIRQMVFIDCTFENVIFDICIITGTVFRDCDCSDVRFNGCIVKDSRVPDVGVQIKNTGLGGINE